MEIILPLFLLIIGILTLILGSAVLVGCANLLARRWNVSCFLIGLLVVGFCSSLPKLLLALFSLSHKGDGMAMGSILSCNIANLLLVFGVASMLAPITIKRSLLARDSAFLALSTIVLLVVVMNEFVSIQSAFLMSMTLAFYLYYAYHTDKEYLQKNPEENVTPLKYRFYLSTRMGFCLLVCSAVMMLIGAHLVVKNAVLLSTQLEIPETLIGISILAFSASLPELTTAITASLTNKSDIALGNILGSNIYNSLFVLGTAAFFFPIRIPKTLQFDVWVMTFVTLGVLGLCYFLKKIGKNWGTAFIIAYFAYILYSGARI